MSIPTTDNTELFLGGSGQETVPQNVIVKGTTWSLYKAGGRLYIQEYGSAYQYRFTFVVNKFTLSRATDLSGVFYTDRFWLWYTDMSNALTLKEIEPFTGLPPTTHVTKSIASDILDMSVYVEESSPIKVVAIYSYI
jgi:hypothetical protein